MSLGELAAAPFAELDGDMQIRNLADHECEHGRIAGDRTPPCGCFAGERPRTPSIEQRTRESNARMQERKNEVPKTYEILGRAYKVGRGPSTISATQVEVLECLRATETRLSTPQIAEACKLDEGRVASMLGAMEKRGFVVGGLGGPGSKKLWVIAPEIPAPAKREPKAPAPAKRAPKAEPTPDLIGLLDAQIAAAQAKVERLRAARELLAA
jgi:hypothetical protein